MIYTVTFNPSVDYSVYTGEIKFGMTNRSIREEIRFGGKGVNVSCVLAELEIPSVALGFVAGFTGRALEEDLTARGITSRFIHLPHGLSRINVKIHSDTETEINGGGPDIPADSLAQLMAQLDGLAAGDTLVLAGSIPPSLPSDIYERILRAVSGKSIRCVVDASGALLVNTLPYKPFLIKPNRQELEEIFAVPIHSQENIAQYGRRLQAMGARNVLISLGGDGAVLLDERGDIHVRPAIPCTVVSTVGAGDSMLAGFLAGYDRTTGEFSSALELGTICGAATASLSGLATKERIREWTPRIP